MPDSVADQIDIFNMQLKKEEQVLRNAGLTYLIVDSPLYLSYFYGSLITDINNNKDRFRLKNLFKEVIQNSSRYSHNIILTSNRHSVSDKFRVWGEETEEIITNGVLFFTHAYRLSSPYIINKELNFEEKIINVYNFLMENK